MLFLCTDKYNVIVIIHAMAQFKDAGPQWSMLDQSSVELWFSIGVVTRHGNFTYALLDVHEGLKTKIPQLLRMKFKIL